MMTTREEQVVEMER